MNDDFMRVKGRRGESFRIWRGRVEERKTKGKTKAENRWYFEGSLERVRLLPGGYCYTIKDKVNPPRFYRQCQRGFCFMVFVK